MPPTPTDPCSEQRELSDLALQEFQNATETRDEAQDSLDDAESPFDADNWNSSAVIVGMAIACGSNPFGWVVCGGGLLVGGTTFVGSEMSRRADIADAQTALNKAERDYDLANNRWQYTMRAEAKCRLQNNLSW